jgi:hypothetical protein
MTVQLLRQQILYGQLFVDAFSTAIEGDYDTQLALNYPMITVSVPSLHIRADITVDEASRCLLEVHSERVPETVVSFDSVEGWLVRVVQHLVSLPTVDCKSISVTIDPLDLGEPRLH